MVGKKRCVMVGQVCDGWSEEVGQKRHVKTIIKHAVLSSTIRLPNLESLYYNCLTE